MKLPESITQLIGKTNDTTEYYFSLVLGRDGASVAAWSMGASNELLIASVTHGILQNDTWDERIKVVDQLLSSTEDKAHVSLPITKTVFGMPPTFLTPDGNIPNEIRTQLHKLSTMLELKPVGFVSLTQAIAFSLKKEQGVPASVILVNCTKGTITVSLYRVGICVREETCDVQESVAIALETFLTVGNDSDVLPSRILLYGENSDVLEQVRGSLLKHQWPAKANFLHFPKIEVFSHEELLTAVSLAGSAELTASIGEVEEKAEDYVGSTVVAQPQTEQPMHVSVEDEEDVENIKVVEAESLGFEREDVTESQPTPRKKGIFPKFAFTLPSFSFPAIQRMKLPHFPTGFRVQKSSSVIFISIAAVLLIGLLYYFVPRVAVTVLVLPTAVSETATIIVDPIATIVDSATKTIPGQTQELSLSSQKTFPVTGKKSVGDPAKGTATFYNKITSERILKKGTVLTAKGVSFALDEEIKIASASESIGSITFGKKDGAITAIDIGQAGNVAAATEFTIKDISPTSVSARNDAAFTGGVSREVTVVSRTDYDGAVKTLTDEIVDKAKAQLLAEVGGNRLIEQTIKTKVSEKVFDKELDQEAKELSGNVTASVSGIVIRDEDIKSLLVALITPKVPAGYSLELGKTDVSVGAVQVKKDGKITVSATVSVVALPMVSIDGVRNQLAGKKVSEALEHLKSIVGVSGAEFRFILSPTQNRLPLNKTNITVSIAVQ